MAKNKVQCPYGHFYNADRYTECPACNPDLASASKATFGIEPSKVTTASGSQFDQPSAVPSQTPSRSSENYTPTESVFGNQNITPTSGNLDKTASIFQHEPVSAPVQTPQHPAPVTETAPQQVPAASAPSSLQAAVNAVVSHKDTEDVKTVAMWNAPAGAEPVVGWLVCVKGEYFGQSFNLKTGNNSVGRAMNMDIPLAQEPSVSRNKHCVITFEPQNQVFYIQQGESSGLTYLNGNIVMTPTQMNAQDKIKLGTAEFILIPFCMDGFRWEDYSV